VQKLYNKIIYCWTCDYSSKTGEGNLARLFISKKMRYKKILYPQMYFKRNSIFNYKYFTPIFGITLCWYYFFQNKKVAYINYLPLWNFLIFFLLPPKTMIGPITGGSHFSKNSDFIIRKYLFPVFYKISELIILLRYDKPIFSTTLLKKHLGRKIIKKSSFDFIFNYINKKSKKAKNLDVLIYYKNHRNKKKLINYELINKLLELKLKVYCVGDKLKIDEIINLNLVSKKKLNLLLSKTKFSICSEENFYSLFTLDCINNNVKIITSVTNKKYIYKYRNNFIFLNSRYNELKAKLKKYAK
tara:strand:+ start:3545 stop:4444 length:900 start_codon:yes stop_codon:yes gene_type:complete